MSITEKGSTNTTWKFDKNKSIPMSEMRDEELLEALSKCVHRSTQANNLMHESIKKINKLKSELEKENKNVDIQCSRIERYVDLADNLRFFLERDHNIILTDEMNLDEINELREDVIKRYQSA